MYIHRLNNAKFWLEFFTAFITAVAILFVMGWAFFQVKGDWSFLRDVDFYSKTTVTTLLALIMRWLWHRKGRDSARQEEEIHSLENSKTKRVNQVSEQDRLSELEETIKQEVNMNKALAYRDKCDMKISRYRRNKNKQSYWKNEKDKINKWIGGDNEAINIANIKGVKYYKFTPAQVITVNNEYTPSHSFQRASAGRQMTRSYQLNIITMLSYGFVYGVELVFRGWSIESAFVLITQLLILITNIGTGVYMGMRFIQTEYKEDLVHDISFLNRFLNKKEKVA